MKIVFLGNHTVGVRTLSSLAEKVDIAGVVCHPEDPEDGIRYESVYAFAKKRGWDVIRGKGKDKDVYDFIRQRSPDLLWITDYRYLIPRPLIELSPFGAVNLHPSLLPRYRGRAPINWAILKGEKQFGLTAHFVDEGMDTGDIIAQECYELTEEEDISDALNKLYPLYEKIAGRVVGFFLAGNVPRTPQSGEGVSEFPARKPEDGLIDWGADAKTIRDLVRAVAPPYPGAFTFSDGKKMFIFKARVEQDGGEQKCSAGAVLGCGGDSSFLVQCGKGQVKVLSWRWEDSVNKDVSEQGVFSSGETKESPKIVSRESYVGLR